MLPPLLYTIVGEDIILPYFYKGNGRLIASPTNKNCVFRREQAPALRPFIFLRIVGSGFCPMVRGHPLAMLAPDAGRRESEKYNLIYLIIYDIISLIIKAKLYFSSTNTSWNNFLNLI